MGALPESFGYQMVLFVNIAATDLRKNGLHSHVENFGGNVTVDGATNA
jgi:hypothetical protein